MTTEANERMKRHLDAVDPQIETLLAEEARRQATGLELIPSENLVSEAVLEAIDYCTKNKELLDAERSREDERIKRAGRDKWPDVPRTDPVRA